MHVSSIPAGARGRLDRPNTAVYNAVAFGTRAAAVRFCLHMSDALAAHEEKAPTDAAPTLWLAATDDPGGRFLVYACDRSLAAACDVGLAPRVVGRVPFAALPAARCLVVGDSSTLEQA